MQRYIFGFLLSFFLLLSKAGAQEQSKEKISNFPVVDYCEIIKNPHFYGGKTIKLFAEQTSAFEFSGFGSQKCAEKYGQIWAEWEKYESCGDEKTAKILENSNKGIEYNYLEGIFVGKFFVKEEGKSGFGHMNAKPFKLVISCVEKATLLPKEDSGCKRVDETNRFHYLEFVKTEIGVAPNYELRKKKKAKNEELVWFRLVNNSSCSVIIPTIGDALQLEDESIVNVFYKLDPTIRTSRSNIVPLGGFTKTVANIKPTRSVLSAGNSIHFTVPLKYLKQSFKVRKNQRGFWNISVPFDYADRQKTENYEPFYFAQNDLPKEIFKK